MSHVFSVPSSYGKTAQKMDGKLYRATDIGGGRVLLIEVDDDQRTATTPVSSPEPRFDTAGAVEAADQSGSA